MTRTREETREQYTSPTSTAPVVVGFDGYDGGRDALDLAGILTGSRRPIEHSLAGSVTHHLVNESACPILVVPHSRKA